MLGDDKWRTDSHSVLGVEFPVKRTNENENNGTTSLFSQNYLQFVVKTAHIQLRYQWPKVPLSVI